MGEENFITIRSDKSFTQFPDAPVIIKGAEPVIEKSLPVGEIVEHFIFLG